MLRAFVELVSNVVSTFRMARRRQPVIGTRTMPALLPGTKNPQQQDPNLAIPQDGPIALTASSAAKAARPSNHERALTHVSHTSPSPSVSRALHAIHLPLLRMGRQAHSCDGQGMLPPPPSGGGGG